MVWCEYVNETVWEDSWDHEVDPDDGVETRLNCDDWTAWNSEELLNMWFTLREHREWTPNLWKRATYTDFCEFCYVYSYGEDELTKAPVHWCQEFDDPEIRQAWRDLKRFRTFFRHGTYSDFCNFSQRYSK